MSRTIFLRLIAVALVTSIALVAAGCGESVTEKVAEKAAKEALEKEGVTVSGDDESGSITFSDEEGKSSQLSYGDELPDDFPEEVPLPDDAKITSAIKTGTEGEGAGFLIGAEVEQDADEVLKFYKAELEGYEQVMSASTAADSGLASYEGDEWDVNVVVGAQGDKRVLTLTVTAHQG